MSSPIDHATALELEKLRGDLASGFAEIKGSLALLVQRSDQTDRALGEHRDALANQDKRLGVVERQAAASADHGPRIAAVERRLWRMTGAGAALGAIGGAAAGFLH